MLLKLLGGGSDFIVIEGDELFQVSLDSALSLSAVMGSTEFVKYFQFILDVAEQLSGGFISFNGLPGLASFTRYLTV